MRELPSTIEDVQREYRGRGLAVLAVNLGEDPRAVAAWVTQQGVTSTVLLDATLGVARAYRVEYTPTVFLVGRNGKFVGRAIGNKPWLGDKGRALFRLLLGPAP